MTTQTRGTRNAPLRVGQFSAYLGDRNDGMGALLDDGVDVLTGDYLAELTMLVLAKNMRKGKAGYAVPFVEQLERYAPQIAKQGVKVVTNAGGLDPHGCAAAVEEVLDRLGLNLRVAVVTGDDLSPELSTLIDNGHRFEHLDDDRPLPVAADKVVTANAYLGAWPVVAALQQHADIVICPRLTDASLVVAPAAWHFDWKPDDWDKLAGALWAGHAIECGAQVTGGVFSFFHEHEDLGLPAMPIAEIFADGEAVITKPASTDGIVSVDTVKAQLVYEVGNPIYGNPDVFADLTAVEVAPEGPDRVRIRSARGYPPGRRTKVSLCYEGGYRNSMTIGLTGGYQQAKLRWLSRQVEAAIGDTAKFDQYRVSVIGPVSEHEGTLEESTAWVSFAARSRDRADVSRVGFADPISQLGVSNFPGFYSISPPQQERLVAIQWPCLIDKSAVRTQVTIDGEVFDTPWYDAPENQEPPSVAPIPRHDHPVDAASPSDVSVQLGSLFGTRSGDKGGNANLGVWARDEVAFGWLKGHLSVDAVRKLLPETADLRIDRYVLPGIFALNFVVHGYLELGVSSCTRIDPQAKGLGEYLGSKFVQVPRGLADAVNDTH